MKKLTYKTPLHDKILKALNAREKMSKDKMSERYDRWHENEKLYNFYLKETDEDKFRKAQIEAGQQEYYTVYIP